jgi:hypothetical protein
VSSGPLLKRSGTERYMGVKMHVLSTATGTYWAVFDGVATGPFDSVEEAGQRIDRQKAIIRMAFYAGRPVVKARTPRT